MFTLRGWVQQDDSSVTKAFVDLGTRFRADLILLPGHFVCVRLATLTIHLVTCFTCSKCFEGNHVKWCERPLTLTTWRCTCRHQQHVLCRSHPYDDFGQGRDAGTLYRPTALADKTLPKSPALLPLVSYQVTCAAFPCFLITHRSQYLIMNTAQGGDAEPLIAWQLRRAGYQKCCACDIAFLV